MRCPLCVAVLLLACTLTLGGCRDRIFTQQPKVKTLQNSPLITSGMWTRLPPEHTLTIDADVRPVTSHEDVRELPIPLTRALLERGRERYTIDCLPCHGPLGDGDGVVVRRGFPPPPSINSERSRQASVGHFFDVITNGSGRMFSHADRVTVPDRWAIAAYLRVLQRSQHATMQDVPAEDRAGLEEAAP